MSHKDAGQALLDPAGPRGRPDHGRPPADQTRPRRRWQAQASGGWDFVLTGSGQEAAP